jgi:hypothetical protein
MAGKQVETRFTIQFSRTDPTHLQAAEILNRQGRRSKAQYLANAVLHYENCSETTKMTRTSVLDIKVIEAVVYRILQDRANDNADIPSDSVPTTSPNATQSKPLPQQPAEDLDFDEAMESIGEDGFNAIAGALDMFRKK